MKIDGKRDFGNDFWQNAPKTFDTTSLKLYLRCDISITFLWLTCFCSNISLRATLTLFFLLPYGKHTYSSSASTISAVKSQDKPSEVKVLTNLGYFSTILQQFALPFLKNDDI